jgi:glycine/D-amino acid oxidase-like deaminating enzyme
LFDSPPDVARFELANCAAVKSYIELNNVQCEYRPVTGCRTFWTKEEFSKARDAVRALKHDDPKTAERVSIITEHAELDACRVNTKCPGATLTAGAASLWPYKLVAHITKMLVRDPRVNLQTNTPVESVSRGDGERWKLDTPRGSISAKHVILATNGYTSHLLQDFTSLIVPCRGTMTALVPPTQDEGEEEILPNSYGMKCYSPDATAGSDDYLIQRPFRDVPNPKGHLMFGGGKNAGKLPVFGADAADDSIVDTGPVEYLKKGLLDMLKLPGKVSGVSKLQADFAWSGIMGFSRDAAPWVGQIPQQPGLWICAGYTGHGMPNATLCAKAVADMVLESEYGDDANIRALQATMVKDGRIPSSYLVSEERVRGALGLPTVQVQEMTDCMGFVDGKWVVTNSV